MRDTSWLTDNSFWTHEEPAQEPPESFIREHDGVSQTLKAQTNVSFDADAVNARLDALAVEESDMDYGTEW